MALSAKVFRSYTDSDIYHIPSINIHVQLYIILYTFLVFLKSTILLENADQSNWTKLSEINYFEKLNEQ